MVGRSVRTSTNETQANMFLILSSVLIDLERKRNLLRHYQHIHQHIRAYMHTHLLLESNLVNLGFQNLLQQVLLSLFAADSYWRRASSNSWVFIVFIPQRRDQIFQLSVMFEHEYVSSA
jgi:hypothetical protein